MPCLSLISFAILLLFATGSAAADTKHVLMLFSNDSLLPAGNAVASSFQRTLDARNPDGVEIFTEFIDADRFPGPAHEDRVEALLRASTHRSRSTSRSPSGRRHWRS